MAEVKSGFNLFGLLADCWMVPLISSPLSCSSYVLDAGLKMRYLKKAACSLFVGIALGDPCLGDPRLDTLLAVRFKV